MCHCAEPKLEKGQKFLLNDERDWVVVDEDGTTLSGPYNLRDSHYPVKGIPVPVKDE